MTQAEAKKLRRGAHVFQRAKRGHIIKAPWTVIRPYHQYPDGGWTVGLRRINEYWTITPRNCRRFVGKGEE